MNHAGYSWSLRCDGDAWVWAIRAPSGGAPIVSGTAPSRAVAAALVIRAIARGMTEPAVVAEGLAA